MRRYQNLVLVLFILVTLIAGYTPRAQAQAQSTSIKIATATTGGVWHPIGVALGKLITAYVPGLTAAAQATGGAVENLKLLTTGKVDLAFTYDYHVTWLNLGKFPAVTPGKKPVRIVLGMYEHPLHVITRQDAGITSLLDLKGKRVSTSVVNSGAEEQAGYVLKALGIDWNKDFTRQKLSLDDSVAALKAGKLDAFFWSGAVPSQAAPTAALTSLTADPAVKMVILPIQGELADQILKANPEVFHRTLIKKGEYPGLTADVETLAVTAVLTALDTFPAERLTAILGAVFDHKADLASAWQGAKTLTPEKSLAVLAPAPRQYLHPAAAGVFQNRETLYQVATYEALKTGNYDGFETVGWLKQKGDLGFGTFDQLDGEMIMLDGQVYQVKDSGAVVPVTDTVQTPYAAVTRFDQDIFYDLGSLPDIAALQTALDQLIVRKDAFYAIRLETTFKQVRVRSVPRQKKPYPELAQALKLQVIKERQNVKGTVVGLWMPEYIGGVNVPGYHLHFISDDRSFGGHLLEGSLTNTRVSLDEMRYFDIRLRPDQP